MQEHWATYGRNYYQRYDYEGLSTADAAKVFAQIDAHMAVFEAMTPGNKTTNFSYKDSVDGSVSKN